MLESEGRGIRVRPEVTPVVPIALLVAAFMYAAPDAQGKSSALNGAAAN